MEYNSVEHYSMSQGLIPILLVTRKFGIYQKT